MNKISLLIPCFNKQEFYPKLFKCLKNQIDKNFDVIFLNDKSTDNTQFMLEKFQEENHKLFNIEIISLDQNGGLANARNILIEQCKTDYFYFLDPDDQIYNYTIEEFNKAIKENNYQIIYAKNILVLNNIRVFNFLRKIDFSSNKTKEDPVIFLEKESYFIWNKAINKRWFLEQNLPFKKGYIFEDFAVTINLFYRATKTKYINKNTYKYDLNFKGLSKKQSPNRIMGIAHNLDYLYSELKLSQNYHEWEKIEKFFFKNIFIHLFFSSNWNVIKKNKKLFEKPMCELFKTFKRHNIDEKLKRYQSFFSLLFKNAITNYQKAKQLFSKCNI
ncbi:glycosyltransferase family 2 protein [Mesomycoplasma lagogenitalium]|uniref:Glycosyltransferase family 2 protein n=1 Tax=Mesomycoplasma lagogenitalium TaxID=171286 RepID=A0ABY8LTP2_9BACT|nr:glycosyltransferase family 2 protein [Mesomycoplasma lagogenitalium]WGI36609.1 glycosyltransferase family 2 protein [Mesomycoplasma lagogenitalium]